MKKNNKYIFLLIIISLFIFFLDFITKAFFENNKDAIINIFGNIFLFRYTTNTGIAFGISLTGLFLQIISIVIFLFLIFFFIYNVKKNIISYIIFGILFGGILGNVYERLFKGYVVDFIEIWKYPSFNIADACITISVIFLLIYNKKIFKKH